VTGFSPRTRKLIYERSQGLCESCARPGAEIHHRRPRGMGGSQDPQTNTAANGVLLCSGCHRWAESHRTKALMDGLLLRQGQNPGDIPVRYRGAWAYLTEDGTVRHTDHANKEIS
jgi:5-methylcytosine-specific restriction protein A